MNLPPPLHLLGIPGRRIKLRTNPNRFPHLIETISFLRIYDGEAAEFRIAVVGDGEGEWDGRLADVHEEQARRPGRRRSEEVSSWQRLGLRAT